MTLAKAFLTGVVVKAPEKRFTQNDMPIAGFTLNFEQNNESLIRVIAFGQLADTVTATISQGDNVVVEGRLQVNTYKLPNGKDKKVFEINAKNEKKTGIQVQNSNTEVQNSKQDIVSFNQEEISEDLIDEDEIPF